MSTGREILESIVVRSTLMSVFLVRENVTRERLDASNLIDEISGAEMSEVSFVSTMISFLKPPLVTCTSLPRDGCLKPKPQDTSNIPIVDVAES
mmetsp:Transcript_828/g.1989  ORF Transcript_828/g.1989 Transcript_828/m.1989 type:complete len:94 (-) Transcript_828:2842-3123(-)